MSHAETIYRMVRLQQDYAIRDEIDARSKLAAAEMGKQLWEEDSDNGLGMSRCPYNIENANAAVRRAFARRQEVDELVDFVVLTFLNGVKP